VNQGTHVGELKLIRTVKLVRNKKASEKGKILGGKKAEKKGTVRSVKRQRARLRTSITKSRGVRRNECF